MVVELYLFIAVYFELCFIAHALRYSAYGEIILGIGSSLVWPIALFAMIIDPVYSFIKFITLRGYYK